MRRGTAPAPRWRAGNRGDFIRNEVAFTIARPEPEGDFAAFYLARRYGLALPMARTIAALANLAGALS